MYKSFQNHLVKAELSTSCSLVYDGHQALGSGAQDDFRADAAAVVDSEVAGEFDEGSGVVVHLGHEKRVVFGRTGEEDRSI